MGIEVISARHQWPLAEILNIYKIPDEAAAELRAYFPILGMQPAAPAEISIVSPSPAGPPPTLVAA